MTTLGPRGRRSKAPLVSWMTPTLGRPELHEALYEDFCEDAWPDKELVVYDESRAPSVFFGRQKDPRVRYIHAPGAPRIGGVTRIGAARNRMVALARGEILAHRDDDDHYDPGYLTTMVERLGDAALCKLDVWRCLHEPSGTIFEWDTRTTGGKHFALQGAQVKEVDIDPAEMGPDLGPGLLEAFRIGFGWSYVYPRWVAEKYPFPVEGTEDIPWVQGLREAGEAIVFVSDAPHLALHTVHVDPQHPTGGSAHFPQRMLGAAGAPKLYEAVRQRMIGAMGNLIPMELAPLPDGKAIRLEPGRRYSVLASVRRKHSLRALTVRAGAWGAEIEQARDEVSPDEYGVSPTTKDYRLVHIVGVCRQAVTMPWRTPGFLRILGEESTVVRAWVERTALEGALDRRGAEMAGEKAAPEAASPVGAGAAPFGEDALFDLGHEALAPERGDVAIVPGRTYVGSALVKACHTAEVLSGLLERYGVALAELVEKTADREGYRFVMFRGVSGPDAGGMLPWRLPWPQSMMDDSHLISCSLSAPVGAGKAETFQWIPEGFVVDRIATSLDALPRELQCRSLGAGRGTIWWNREGAVVQSRETGRMAILARRPGAGAPATAGAIALLAKAESELAALQAAYSAVTSAVNADPTRDPCQGLGGPATLVPELQAVSDQCCTVAHDAANAAFAFTLNCHGVGAAAYANAEGATVEACSLAYSWAGPESGPYGTETLSGSSQATCLSPSYMNAVGAQVSAAAYAVAQAKAVSDACAAAGEAAVGGSASAAALPSTSPKPLPHTPIAPRPMARVVGTGAAPPGVAIPNATSVAAQYGVIVPAYGQLSPVQAALLAGQLGSFGVTVPSDVQKGVTAISGMLPAAVNAINAIKSGTSSPASIAPLLCAGLAATGVGTVAVAALGAGLAAFSAIATALGLNQQPPPLETCIWSAGNICNNRARPYGPTDPQWVTIEELTSAADAGGIPGLSRLGSNNQQFWGNALGDWWTTVGWELYALGNRSIAAANWATQTQASGNDVSKLAASYLAGGVQDNPQVTTWGTSNVPAQWAKLGAVGIDFCIAFDLAWIKMGEVFINGYAAPDPTAFLSTFITAWNTMHGSEKTVVFDGTGGTFLDFVIDGGGWTSVDGQPVVPQRLAPTAPVNIGQPIATSMCPPGQIPNPAWLVNQALGGSTNAPMCVPLASSAAPMSTTAKVAVGVVAFAGAGAAAAVGAALALGLPWNHYLAVGWEGTKAGAASAWGTATSLYGRSVGAAETRRQNPLRKGPSKKAFDANVRKLRREGYPRDQALAIAYRVQRRG